MSDFDPNFDHLRNARRYSNTITDHDSKFEAFQDYVLNGTKSPVRNAFVIQFVCHPNFKAHLKTTTWYALNEGTGDFEVAVTLPQGYRRANSYKNFKTERGHGHENGLYYELNLYSQDGTSRHHETRVKGINYVRDDAHDIHHGTTKGRHWLA
jgi:hypothetical protein